MTDITATTDITTAATIAELSDWLLIHARMNDEVGTRDAMIVNRLREAGIPIARAMIAMRSLHPQVDAFSATWEEGKEMVFREHLLGNLNTREMAGNPIFIATNYGKNLRYRLTDAPPENETAILTELRESGMIDYVVIALPFGDGTHRAMTFATRNHQGFSDAHVDILNGISTALAAIFEIRYLRYLAGVLMDTYVGATAGRKVLEGAIKRGSSETIHAVIWFCDLKGFTALSESLSADALLDTLNSYFEVMTEAIEVENGEVLKFIGDAVLAIFQPTASGKDAEKDAAMRALTAAQAAMHGLVAVNAMREKNRQPLIQCGIALHFGDLLYGNVGGQRRLDFTVIGPAVNLASRIESLTRDLKQTVLVSETFSEVHGGEFQNLGQFSFKGIREKGNVFAPLEQSPDAT